MNTTDTLAAVPTLPFEFTRNPGACHAAAYGAERSRILNAEGLDEARACISAWPGYAPTPLVALPGLARALNLGAVHYKQEAARFGLRSFKPLGGAYAVQRALMRRLGAIMDHEVSADDILNGRYADAARDITVTAATDGNHGRSVAWGARMFGCRCVIFVNEAVSVAREQAIAAYGAEVCRHPGSFDDAVRHAFETARREHWEVIPDTSDGDVVEAPRNVTQGYALMAAEALEQWPEPEPPTHTFLQAGVGGMAAACCAHLWQQRGAARPTTTLVEPTQAACWFHSLRNGRPTPITGDVDSIMGGLSCGEVSTLAWPILSVGADAAMALDDAITAPVMRLLASGAHGDPPLVGGESGVAGLAGLITAARDEPTRDALGLDSHATVLLFGSEGATDEAMYEQMVGRPWQQVHA